jgi:hypoxanthine phosphoribosyltransferase
VTKSGLQPLISSEEIQARIKALGQELSRTYTGKNPLLVAILKGSYMFLADLSRAIDEPHEVDFVATAAYSGSEPLPGHVRLTKDMDLDIAGRHVLIVEDIVDSGRTLARVCELFRSREPASLNVVTLLDKPEQRAVEVPVTLVGFNVPDRFVVGYGLDLAEQYRHLDGIYICADEAGAEAVATQKRGTTGRDGDEL